MIVARALKGKDMKELQWGSLFVMLGCVVGCSKSPDSVCEHYMGLRKEAKLTTDATAADACKSNLSALKERSLHAWKCSSQCILGATDFKTADKCPVSCETQYGNNGESFEGAEDTAVRERWDNGICGDTGKAGELKRLEDHLSERAAEKARVLEACVAECKPKHEVGTKEYTSCLNRCQIKKLMDAAK